MMKLKESQVKSVVESCLELYRKLPKTGKPLESEWTVLSCVVEYESTRGEHRVVSLGTGSKCVGAGSMAAAGDVLNDSHAEVVARRGLLLHFYNNMLSAGEDKTSIFRKATNRFSLKENIEYIFYSSQLPCGDASILPKCGEEEQFGDVVSAGAGRRRRAADDICDTHTKVLKVQYDIHRTGAKCLPDSEQDPRKQGIDYHLLGQVRTKPGRGDRTLSVSCSDKLARWIHCGLQGALVDMLSHLIHFSHFIFGAGVPYSEDSLSRALLQRDINTFVKLENAPNFYQSSICFDHVKSPDRLKPAPGSIVWTASQQNTEVAVQGRKQGLTKKMSVLPKHSLCISKYKLYEKFRKVLNCNEDIKQALLGDTVLENVGYNEMKRKSTRYKERWMHVKENFFKMWTMKPDLWDFTLPAGDSSPPHANT